MKSKEMLVRVRYVFEGKEQERVFYKTGNNNLALRKGFESIKEMYVGLQHREGLRHLDISCELIYEKRPMIFTHKS